MIATCYGQAACLHHAAATFTSYQSSQDWVLFACCVTLALRKRDNVLVFVWVGCARACHLNYNFYGVTYHRYVTIEPQLVSKDMLIQGHADTVKAH